MRKREGAKTRREENRLTEEQTHKTLSTYQKHHQINNPFFFPPLKNPTNNYNPFLHPSPPQKKHNPKS
jgi:hypothetical protein